MRWRWGAIAALTALALVQTGCMFLGIQTRAKPKFALRVNVGMHDLYTDKTGNVWLPEEQYTEAAAYGLVGGSVVDRGDMKITGTDDPRIYQTEHYSMESFIARVPNGTYTVRLHFAETYPNIDTDGPRVFDVKIQNKVVLKDFDISKTAGGVQRALVKTFEGVEVSDGKIEITFVPNQQNPEINGIEILGE